jgi:hypothetical protein
LPEIRCPPINSAPFAIPAFIPPKGLDAMVDPQRNDTMYMGGEIVRREQSETFNLRPGPSPTAIRQTSFPPMDSQTALNPAFTAELEQKVELQNKLMSALIEQNKVAEANAKMTAEVADKLARQEAETNALKDKMKSIEEQKQSPATTAKTKPKSWKWWEK